MTNQNGGKPPATLKAEPVAQVVFATRTDRHFPKHSISLTTVPNGATRGRHGVPRCPGAERPHI